MSSVVLERDTDIPFPHFVVLKASAGSGKTYALTSRYVQLALSMHVQRNALRNILAVTFSNNAAKEMRVRILSWLKAAYFGESGKADELLALLSLDRQDLRDRAARLIGDIIDNYADFQVQTIDSFMTGLFKASALEFGYTSEFEIAMSKKALMEQAFNLYLRKVRQGTEEAELLKDIVRLLTEHRKSDTVYPWDPSQVILDEVMTIYGKVAAMGGEPKAEECGQRMSAHVAEIKGFAARLDEAIRTSGLRKSRNSSYDTIRQLISECRWPDLLDKGLKRSPVNRPKQQSGQAAEDYERVITLWDELVEAIRRSARTLCHLSVVPYVTAYLSFRDVLEKVKRQQGTVFIEDINRDLATYISGCSVPDVYFRTGETVLHFLIDEFQDTSPIQWQNLFPLIENSLSQGGSLFVVGDTKQAIYGFRHADYRIMKSAESQNPFPAAHYSVRELQTNYRSSEAVVRFSEKGFAQIPASGELQREAAKRSGLSDYHQVVREEKRGRGYVEVVFLDRNDEDPPERKKVQDIIDDLRARGFSCGDIALLTRKNDDVVKATTWLNEKRIPFVSLSSLDIRRRKATAEIVSLLRFLDSPQDHLSFAVFLLSDVFAGALDLSGRAMEREKLHRFLLAAKGEGPLYTSFRETFPELWHAYFDGLFRVAGYLPLYDLVTEAYRVFRVFETLPEEEATLVRILESVKEIEGAGRNSLAEFIESAEEGEGDDSGWKIDVPAGLDAVKVMTIHKAKGLGFAAVIMLLYEEQQKGLDYVAVKDPDGIRLMKLSRKTAECDADLETIYVEARVYEAVNTLNTLYVGFTRAAEELYVIAVRGAKRSDPSFDVIPTEGSGRGAKSDHVGIQEPGAVAPAPVLFGAKPLTVPASPGRLSRVEDLMRGEFVHRVLCLLDENAADTSSAISEAIRRAELEMRIDVSEDEIGDEIVALLSGSETADLFAVKKERRVLKEQEFVDREGRLYRMDRVVRDGNAITVVDFKTGDATAVEELKYDDQMRNYMKLLREVYPLCEVGGAIVYTDLKKVRRLA